MHPQSHTMPRYCPKHPDRKLFNKDGCDWCARAASAKKAQAKPKVAPVKKATPIKKKVTPPKPRKKISQVSIQRGKELAIYSIVRKKYLLEHPKCGANLPGCTKQATEIHHKRGKTNHSLNQVEHFLPICRNCHNYITEHSAEAIKLGLSERRTAKMPIIIILIAVFVLKSAINCYLLVT